MALIELGLVDGNYFNDDHVNAIEAAINQCAPAGTVRMTIESSVTTGWLLLQGQTVTNGQSLYPDLWAVAPAAWKSGANLILPNATSRFPIGGGTLGSIGSGNTKTIATGNLPVHSHTMDHDHGTALSGGRTVGHTHSGTTSAMSANASHNHVMNGGGAVLTQVGSPSSWNFGDGIGGGASYVLYATTQTIGTTNTDHVHSVTTGTESSDHQHYTDLPNYTGSTGNTGSGTALDITPAYFAVNFAIKAH